MYQSYKIIKVSTIRDSNYGYVDPFGSENMVNPPAPFEGGEFGLPPTYRGGDFGCPPICVPLHLFTERSQLSPVYFFGKNPTPILNCLDTYKIAKLIKIHEGVAF